MRKLVLPIKKQWFDMILSGEKKEEYREFKPYYVNRLTWHEYHGKVGLADLIYIKKDYFTRMFETVKFTNGYGKKVPYLICELNEISCGNGNEAWGFTDACFILHLGKILETGNLCIP